jgi:parvulin-like peptidyl-prolyl isomerase
MDTIEERLKLKSKRYFSLFFVVLLAAQVLFVGCQKKEVANIATINDQKVGVDEFNLYLWSVQQSFEAMDKDIWDTDFGDGKTAEEVAKERALDSITAVKVKLQEAEKLGVSLTDEEKKQAKEQAATLIAQMGEEKAKEMGIDEKLIIKIMEENTIGYKMYEEVTKDFALDEEGFEKYYKENEESLKQVRAKHILLKTHDFGEDGQLVPLTEEQQNKALEKAQEALNRAKAGEDFAALVKEYSEDEGSVQNDGEYTFGKGQMVPEFEETAFSLEPGQISDLVQTAYGYHIIKVEEKIDPNKQLVKQSYTNEQKQTFFMQKIEEWVKQATVTKEEEVWKSIKIQRSEEEEEPAEQSTEENSEQNTKQDEQKDAE